jgi:hypothetical protein
MFISSYGLLSAFLFCETTEFDLHHRTRSCPFLVGVAAQCSAQGFAISRDLARFMPGTKAEISRQRTSNREIYKSLQIRENHVYEWLNRYRSSRLSRVTIANRFPQQHAELPNPARSKLAKLFRLMKGRKSIPVSNRSQMQHHLSSQFENLPRNGPPQVRCSNGSSPSKSCELMKECKSIEVNHRHEMPIRQEDERCNQSRMSQTQSTSSLRSIHPKS